MGKYFRMSARHEKARKFLELKQGMMTMLEYMAKFTELAFRRILCGHRHGQSEKV